MSGRSQMAVKMSSCKSCPIKKELYNSPLSLEEKLILHLLSSVKHSSGSYESTSETSDQTVAQCQSRQAAKIIAYYVILRGFWTTSVRQSFLRTFLKLYSNSVHFKKRRSIEQAFSKCQEHNAGHAVGALKSTLPFLHKFQPFLPDDTIFVENMKRYARCLKIIRSACFFTDSFQENFPQTRYSSCCQPFSLSQ